MTRGFCPSLDDLWGSGHDEPLFVIVIVCTTPLPTASRNVLTSKPPQGGVGQSGVLVSSQTGDLTNY